MAAGERPASEMERSAEQWAHAIEGELTDAPPEGWPGRMPDFFVVGHPKSGTTALYGLLGQHPEVFVGEKEPRFFCTELRERDVPRKSAQPLTVAQYTSWFARAAPGQLVGDVSPDYLWSAHATRLIAQARPEARIVVILREPVAFLRSLHLQRLQGYVEVESDLRRALELEARRREGDQLPSDTYWPRALMYMDAVRYVQQLQSLHEHFPREQVLVLIYDDYRRDNLAAVRSILQLLSLDADAPLRPREANPSVQVRRAALNTALRRLIVADQPAYRVLKGSIKTLTPMRARQRLLHAVRKKVVLGSPQKSEQEFDLELRRRLKAEVSTLSEYLGRDLVSLWGYDSL